MANPQAENGHVDIANEIVEALAKIHLSSYESRVLWTVFRKTYGWHKKEDWITNTQIANLTGIAETHISRTIKILIQKNLIIKNGKKLGFQKDYDRWEKLPKGVTSHHDKKLPKGVSNITKGGNKKLPKGVTSHHDKKLPKGVSNITKGGNKKLPKGVYTKETKRNYTKETIQKKGDIFIKAWKDFKEMRKKIKKPMTERAEELLIKKLNDLSGNEKEQIAILNQSIMNSWLGVFPLRGDYNGKGRQNNQRFGSKEPGEDKYKHLEETY